MRVCVCVCLCCCCLSLSLSFFFLPPSSSFFLLFLLPSLLGSFLPCILLLPVINPPFERREREETPAFCYVASPTDIHFLLYQWQRFSPEVETPLPYLLRCGEEGCLIDDEWNELKIEVKLRRIRLSPPSSEQLLSFRVKWSVEHRVDWSSGLGSVIESGTRWIRIGIWVESTV